MLPAGKGWDERYPIADRNRDCGARSKARNVRTRTLTFAILRRGSSSCSREWREAAQQDPTTVCPLAQHTCSFHRFFPRKLSECSAELLRFVCVPNGVHGKLPPMRLSAKIPMY